MNIANINYDFSYKNHINKIAVEEPITDIVKKLNRYDWCMTWQSCGGHLKADGKKSNPWISFIIKKESFFKYLLFKCSDYNETNSSLLFEIMIEFDDTRTNFNLQKWIKLDVIVPTITVVFRVDVAIRMNTNFNEKKPSFSEMKKMFLSWFKEFSG